MAPQLELADDQRFALMKFRRSVHEVLKPHHDDRYLLRWLRARKWDAVAAEKMLRDSLEWRNKWGVDTLAEWDPPQVLKDHLPHGICGFDKDGAPVVIVPFAGFDVYGVLHAVPRSDLMKIMMQQLERYLDICEKQGLKHGPIARQVTVIFDMEGFNIRQYAWRPAGEVVIALIQMYEANYPEILKTCFIINAPKIFAFAFSVVKNFMNEYTISKIHIYKADPTKWQPALLRTISADQLPKHFGGNLTDPDGNPRLATKICQGGKVPKHMYMKNVEIEKDDESHKSTTIKKGDKLSLDFIAVEDGSFLRWEFRTEGHDIKFGIIMKSEDGAESEVVPVHRVASNQMDEVGVITCQAPATYSVIFDNSYSLMRNKKIHYSVDISPPLGRAATDLTAAET